MVYRGEDERLHRPVCIKVFHRVRSGDGPYKTAYEHFVQEAFALSKLTHPNTLRIYDFGHLDGPDGEGPPFQVSEFMTDGTLWSQVRRHGPMAPDESARILVALGGALGEAHHAGLIHRDIKPHNILFTSAGPRLVAKLADFGIAKALPTEAADFRHRADDTSVVVGRPFLMYSPWWAAPEQLSGMPVGRPADIYAMALSIVYMLTANVVFRENDPVTAYEQRKNSGRYVSSACDGADMPEKVLALLQQACEFDPGRRPEDVEDFTGTIADELRDELWRRVSKPHGEAPPRPTQQQQPPQPPSHITEPPPPPRPRLHSVPSPDLHQPEGSRITAPPRRVHVNDPPQVVGERKLRFVSADDGETITTCLGGSTRLRVAFVPGAEGICVHVRGLTCFVARDRGRPSSAVLFESDGDCHLVTPSRQELGIAKVSLGKAAAGHRVFVLGGESIAVSVDECPQVAAFDFGAGGECLLVYRPVLGQTRRPSSNSSAR